jgi:hypothetical protein
MILTLLGFIRRIKIFIVAFINIFESDNILFSWESFIEQSSNKRLKFYGTGTEFG